MCVYCAKKKRYKEAARSLHEFNKKAKSHRPPKVTSQAKRAPHGSTGGSVGLGGNTGTTGNENEPLTNN